LLTGEYFVLDGARALALPTRPGQSLSVEENAMIDWLHWAGYDEKGAMWFWAGFDFKTLDILDTNDAEVATRLRDILAVIREWKPRLFRRKKGLDFKTTLDFPRNWGLGTSSTLIQNLARWAEVPAFDLLQKTFGGSGYDLACAAADGPIVYQLEKGKPRWETVPFDPPFSEAMYFVFLGKKQNSREGIARYRARPAEARHIAQISEWTDQIRMADSLAQFECLLAKHENLIARTLDLPRAKDLYFADFWGEIKSLGAWGGDFVLATSDRPPEETRRYFEGKGFEVFLKYADLILNPSK
ncbi:MAG: hypothetical protein D6714_01590, partial [Bacteroidetes bacterium]